MSMVIKRGGLLTTVQDLGRYGYQNLGFSQSGAVDQYSIQVANLLVGNDNNEAVLELTILGPTLEFTADNIIAITGADLSAVHNGAPAPMYRAFLACKGDTLAFPMRKVGCRAYLAVAGGLDIPLVMGSRSTYIKGKIGGYQGRFLRDGDEIQFRAPQTYFPNLVGRTVTPQPIETDGLVLRVIRGPQEAAFTKAGYETFFSSEYHVSAESDRMGCRLNGPAIEHIKDGNTISDGVPMGGIQIPTGGTPIIMLADKQCIGGYTKIATVITVDLPKIAQCMPGDKVRFEEIGIDAAQDLYLQQVKELEQLRTRLNDAGNSRVFSVKVNGVDYQVVVSEIRATEEEA